MEKTAYIQPETDIVRLSHHLLQDIGYEGGTVSGGNDDVINPANEGFFDDLEDTVTPKSANHLWDE